MRENGVTGLIRIIFECVRDGFGPVRAWQVMAVIAAVPLAIIGLILLLVL